MKLFTIIAFVFGSLVATTASAIAVEYDVNVACVQAELIEVGQEPGPGPADGLFGAKTVASASAWADGELPEMTIENAGAYCIALSVRRCRNVSFDPLEVMADDSSPFIGIFKGWFGDVESTLAVSSIDEDGNAVGFYANDPASGVRAGCYKFLPGDEYHAEVDENGNLSLVMDIYASVLYEKAQEGGGLTGTYQPGGFPGTFRRIQ